MATAHAHARQSLHTAQFHPPQPLMNALFVRDSDFTHENRDKILDRFWLREKPVPARYCSSVLSGVAFDYADSWADLRVSFHAWFLRLQPHKCRNQSAI